MSVDKTSYTSSDFECMRLIRRGDNPNKENLIYIPYTPYRHHLSSYNLSCPQCDRIEMLGVIIMSQRSHTCNGYDNLIVQ